MGSTITFGPVFSLSSEHLSSFQMLALFTAVLSYMTWWNRSVGTMT